LALQQLSESVVEALSSLVGAHAAARGAHKLFLTLQNTTHNKQLFYVSHHYYFKYRHWLNKVSRISSAY
jgi:hypothetical protein